MGFDSLPSLLFSGFFGVNIILRRQDKIYYEHSQYSGISLPNLVWQMRIHVFDFSVGLKEKGDGQVTTGSEHPCLSQTYLLTHSVGLSSCRHQVRETFMTANSTTITQPPQFVRL